jgi:hypothetical protein
MKSGSEVKRGSAVKRGSEVKRGSAVKRGEEVKRRRSCGHDASGDVDHTGHGSFSLSNVIVCEDGVETGDGCCCHGVLISKTSRDSLLKPDSGDNTAEVVGGGN